MQRTLIGAGALRAWLNTELKMLDKCANCEFDEIMLIQSVDDSGCNWSDPWLRCSGQPAAICGPLAQKVVADARARFQY